MSDWFRLACLCPRCKRRPSEQYTVAFVNLAKKQAPDQPWANYKCRKCGTVFLIAWVAIAYAEPAQPSSQDMPWAA